MPDLVEFKVYCLDWVFLQEILLKKSENNTKSLQY